MQAQDEQALHSTCRPSCQRQRSQLPGGDTRCQCTHRKDKICGWVGGPVCSCKTEKQTAQRKGSNLLSRTTVKAESAVVLATDSLHQNFNTAYRGSNRLSVVGQSNAAHMQRQDEQALHSTCRPSCQPLYERMRGSTQTPCKPREKFNTNKAIRLTFRSCLPALNTVSDIAVRVKGSQPTRRVGRIQIRTYPENTHRAIIPALEPEQLPKKYLLATQKNTPAHTQNLCPTNVAVRANYNIRQAHVATQAQRINCSIQFCLL